MYLSADEDAETRKMAARAASELVSGEESLLLLLVGSLAKAACLGRFDEEPEVAEDWTRVRGIKDNDDDADLAWAVLHSSYRVRRLGAAAVIASAGSSKRAKPASPELVDALLKVCSGPGFAGKDLVLTACGAVVPGDLAAMCLLHEGLDKLAADRFHRKAALDALGVALRKSAGQPRECAERLATWLLSEQVEEEPLLWAAGIGAFGETDDPAAAMVAAKGLSGTASWNVKVQALGLVQRRVRPGELYDTTLRALVLRELREAKKPSVLVAALGAVKGARGDEDWRLAIEPLTRHAEAAVVKVAVEALVVVMR
jgi:hypothetical protein